MKKILFVLIFVIGSLGNANSQPFYYYKDTKIALNEEFNKVGVRFTKDVSPDEYESMISNLKDLGISTESKFDPRCRFVVLNLDRNNSTEVMARLNAFPKVLVAGRLLRVESGNLMVLTDEVVLEFLEKNEENNRRWLESNNCTVIKAYAKKPGVFRVSFGKNPDPLMKANKMYQEEIFRYCEPNLEILNILNTNDPEFPDQFNLKNTGSVHMSVAGEDINVETAWAITYGNTSIKIAVIDDGVDLDHPDLAANLLPGYDATGNNTAGSFLGSSEKHGSACAGIVGAIADNGIGIAGVAPRCKIIPIKSALGANGSFADFAEGIDFAVSAGADVISNSWSGGGPSTVLEDAITNAFTYGRNGLGCVIVQSSGNDGNSSVNYPCMVPGIISVGAFDRRGDRPAYANHGLGLTLSASSAKGDGIYRDIPTIDNDGEYTKFWGTSAACPQVAGAAALMLSVNPCLTYSEVKSILELSARRTQEQYCYSGGTAFYNEDFGSGKLDVGSAVRIATNYDQKLEFSNLNFTQIGSTQQIPIINACGLAGAVYIGKVYQATVTVNSGGDPTVAYWLATNGNNPLYSVNPTTGTTSMSVKTYYVENTISGQVINQWYPVAPNYIKLWANRYNPGDLFLQNRTENNLMQTYRSPTIVRAGKNVTALVPQGNYTLNSSNNVKLIGKNGVFLEPGFECASGNYFEARVGFNTCANYPNGLEKPSGEDESGLTTNKLQLDHISDKALIDNFSIYPNPTDNDVHLEVDASMVNTEAAIFSTDGRMVSKIKISSTHSQVDLSKLTSGIYFIKLETPNGTVTKKIIKK